MRKSNIFVGVDLHKNNFSYVMMDAHGHQIREGKHTTSVEDVAGFASSLDRRHKVALEPLTNGYWFINSIRDYVQSVHLANPYKVRLIAE